MTGASRATLCAHDQDVRGMYKGKCAPVQMPLVHQQAAWVNANVPALAEIEAALSSPLCLGLHAGD